MSFDEVVHLDHDQAAVIGAMLDQAATSYTPVRVAIDDGGVKLSIGRGVWTPPIGTRREPREPSVVVIE